MTLILLNVFLYGIVAYGHWSGYFANHELYNNNVDNEQENNHEGLEEEHNATHV